MTPSYVRITDVSPRDGLQNEPSIIPTADKAHLVRLLCAARVDEVEVSSFVSARWVPQMGDAPELFAALAADKPPDVCFSALTPNAHGLADALRVNQAAGGHLIDKIAVFTAASESFAQRNINASIAESLARFQPVVQTARASGLRVRAYISCAIACPFEGAIDPQRVADLAEQLAALGVDELDLGDTIGAGSPPSTSAMLLAVIARLGADSTPRLTLHLHDTFGQAVECAVAALQLGIRSFDGAAGGLGGCPYASTPQRRAPGNIATETLLRTLQARGLATRVDVAALELAAAYARSLRERG